MRSNNLLGHITGWNLLLTGFLRTKALGLMHLTLQDIAESGLKPNLTTYKTLVDGARVINESDTYRRAAYDYWRDFNKESPMLRPDVDFMNKLLYCCRKCRHVERGFYFLDVMEKYDLDPDMDTFREILLVSIKCTCINLSLYHYAKPMVVNIHQIWNTTIIRMSECVSV